MAVKRITSRLPVYHFGRAFPPGTHEAQAALELFSQGYQCRHAPHFGWGRFEFFQMAAQAHLPTVKWRDESGRVENTWMLDQIRSLCGVPGDGGESVIGRTRVRCAYWTGCAAAGKTFSAALFAFMWFMASPKDSSVTLTSTTKDAIGQRVWPVIQRLRSEWQDPNQGVPCSPGNIIDSMKKFQGSKGDDKHAIFAQAVEKGETHRAVNGLKGRHTRRMMLVIDEANTAPNAIFETIHNMSAGCEELIILIIGNALSKLDNHGRCCEPEAGWESIKISTGKWRTAGVPDWKLEPGICLHFDGDRSPNVMHKHTYFPFLYTWENYLRRRPGCKSIQFFSNERGFWPLEGTTDTVLNEVLVAQYGMRGTFVFDGEARILAAIDPGFKGDKCIAGFGRLGNVGGRMSLLFTEEVEIELDAELDTPLDHQVARQFIAMCRKLGVQPQDAGCDATGTGRGVYAILQEEWSHEMVRVEFGGKPSEMLAGGGDARTGVEAYDRMVTELWYSIRHLGMAEQLKGLTREMVVQLCTREYTLLPRSKIRLDEKEECKKKLGRSPDNADMLAVMVKVARLKGLVAEGPAMERDSQDWGKLLREVGDLSNDGMVEQVEVEVLTSGDFDDMRPELTISQHGYEQEYNL